jgi:hypothetical protein
MDNPRSAINSCTSRKLKRESQVPPDAGQDNGGFEPALTEQGWSAGNHADTLSDPQVQHFHPDTCDQPEGRPPRVSDHPMGSRLGLGQCPWSCGTDMDTFALDERGRLS